MNIQQENLDKLNALVHINLAPEDYMNNYEKALKDYGKRVALPGFRPGKVPAALVKKRFGKSLLAEEINKVINQALQSHIESNQLEVLGNPMPAQSEDDGGNWDNPADFKFSYELGLAPEFSLQLSTKDKQDYYLIKVDEEMINKQVSDLARRYGKIGTPEVAGENDLLICELLPVQTEENEEELSPVQTTVSLEFVKDKTTKKSLLGAKVGDQITVDPKKLAENDHDLARMLQISHDQIKSLPSEYFLNVKELRSLAPADVDQELFDKIFGKDAVQDEAEFRAKIAEQLRNQFVNDSQRLFKKHITEALIEKANLTLPDTFLKKWIMASNERPISDEQLAAEYPSFANGLKWQLIENKLFKEGGLTIENEALMEEAKNIMADQFARYGVPIADDNILTQSAQRLLSNRDEMKYVYEQVAEKKLMNYIKENISIKEKEVSFDEFVALANKA